MLGASSQNTREQKRRILTLTSECAKHREALAVAEESRRSLDSQHEQQMNRLLAECAQHTRTGARAIARSLVPLRLAISVPTARAAPTLRQPPPPTDRPLPSPLHPAVSEIVRART